MTLFRGRIGRIEVVRRGRNEVVRQGRTDWESHRA